jgi:hypothetical protein
MADKIKMAAKHTFSIAQSICMPIIWDLERTSSKKNIVEVTFFKTSKWRIKSRWRQHSQFFSLGSHTGVSRPILKCEPTWTCRNKHYGISAGPNYKKILVCIKMYWAMEISCLAAILILSTILFFCSNLFFYFFKWFELLIYH